MSNVYPIGAVSLFKVGITEVEDKNGKTTDNAYLPYRTTG